jgi:hypothetical protein
VLELRKETETEETNAEEAERGRFRQPEDEQPWARGGSLAGRAALPGTGNSRALPVRATGGRLITILPKNWHPPMAEAEATARCPDCAPAQTQARSRNSAT